jgi:hypothetical protein
MAVHYTAPGFSQRPQQNNLQVTVMPAPTRGVDARAPTGNMPSDVCIYTYNLMPAEYGMLLRSGYREWCLGTDMDLGNSTGVHTLIPFTGVLAGGQDDRLFAITNEAIWDVSTVDTPINKLTFASDQPGSGHGVFCHYIDQGGDDFMYYADGINGLHIYNGLSAAVNPDTWAPAAGITGPSLPTVVFVMVHKQRMWLVEEGKSSAWYLPINAGQGDATEFFFGGKFPHGGRVYAMYNWSIDGGKGIDDLLVVISSSGDVIVYEGDDPAAAETWKIRGTYYIGDMPVGRRVGSEYSGDLYLLSSFGLISMSDLIRGVDTQNPAEHSLSFRVARPLRTQIRQKKTLYGWEPIFLPAIGQLMVLIPQADTESWIQYSLTLATEGWGFWRGVPMTCVADWFGVIFFGSDNGTVYAMDVSRDNVLLTPPPEPQLNGNPIDFSLLSSYQNLGSPGLFKRVQMVRPDFYGNAAPAYNIKVLYDYDFQEPDAVVQSDEAAPQGDEWDGGLWDIAVWSTQVGQSYGSLQLAGASGIGRSVAIAMRGSSGEELRLITWDIMWQVGGPV